MSICSRAPSSRSRSSMRPWRPRCSAAACSRWAAASSRPRRPWACRDFAALRLIVLPQAVTAVVPALVNIMIAVIKETTLLSVIGVNDLLGAVENGAKSPGLDRRVQHPDIGPRVPGAGVPHRLLRAVALQPPARSSALSFADRHDDDSRARHPAATRRSRACRASTSGTAHYHALRDIDLQVAPGERIVDLRPVGLGQVDAGAHREPARAFPAGPPARSAASTSARTPSRVPRALP